MKRFVKRGLSVLFFLMPGISDLLASPVIWELTDSTLVGEVDQIEGVAGALVQKFRREGGPQPQIHTLDLKGSGPEMMSVLAEVPRDNPQAIFVSSGVYGIESFRHLKKGGTRGIFIYVSHQIIGEGEEGLHLKNLVNVADLIVLPHHVFEISDPRAEELKAILKGSRTGLLSITGVVHNVHPEDLLRDVARYRDEIPPAKKYMLVILGGDVQRKDGKTWVYYTREEAERLAQYVKVQMEEDPSLFVLVTNGPRTGRFDPATGEEAPFHQKGGPLDPVTGIFMKSLADLSRVKLYNFERGQESRFKALLGVMAETRGVVLVPGETTTMISQTIDNMPEGSVVLYSHGAMLDIHMRHLKREFEKRRAHLLSSLQSGGKYSLSRTPEGARSEPFTSSTLVADAIWQMLQSSK